MNAKDYLSQAFLLDKRIDSKLLRKERLQSQAMKVTASYQLDKVSSTHVRSQMENSTVKIIDLENEINSDIDRLLQIKTELSRFIARVDDPAQKLILELRYLDGLSWEDVSTTLGYNLRWVFRIHRKALSEADKLMGSSLRRETSYS